MPAAKDKRVAKDRRVATDNSANTPGYKKAQERNRKTYNEIRDFVMGPDKQKVKVKTPIQKREGLISKTGKNLSRGPKFLPEVTVKPVKSVGKAKVRTNSPVTPKKQGAIVPGVTTSGSAVKKSNESTWNSTKRAELSVDRGSNMPNVARKAMPTITDMPSRTNSVKELRGQIREVKKGNRKEARTSKKINRLQNKLNKLTKK